MSPKSGITTDAEFSFEIVVMIVVVVTGKVASVDGAGCVVLFCVIVGAGAGALVVSVVSSFSTCSVQLSKSKIKVSLVADSVSLICGLRVPSNHSCMAGVGIWIGSSSLESAEIEEKLFSLVDTVVVISGISKVAFCIAYDS